MRRRSQHARGRSLVTCRASDSRTNSAGEDDLRHWPSTLALAPRVPRWISIMSGLCAGKSRAASLG